MREVLERGVRVGSTEGVAEEAAAAVGVCGVRRPRVAYLPGTQTIHARCQQPLQFKMELRGGTPEPMQQGITVLRVRQVLSGILGVVTQPIQVGVVLVVEEQVAVAVVAEGVIFIWDRELTLEEMVGMGLWVVLE